MHVASLWITMMAIHDGVPLVLLPQFSPGTMLDAIERFAADVIERPELAAKRLGAAART